MASEPATTSPPGRFPWWLLLGSILIPCLYLPMLTAPFDFTDDSIFVYDGVHPPRSLAEHVGELGERMQRDYRIMGVYFPVNRIHRYLLAELLGEEAWHWRAARLAWSMVACATLLWLLRELGLPPTAALVAGAAAFWNPFRNEIWMTLINGEGEGMPYALAALICALRAARSSNSWRWDVAGFLAALAAMGCKPTMAAIVPAQLLLRLAPDGRNILAGLRRQWPRVLFLGTTLAWPALLTVLRSLNWHEGQYRAGGASVNQALQLILAVGKAMSLDFLAAGLVLALIAVGWKALRNLAYQFRAPLLAGLALLAAGIVIYLPVGAVAPRYSMPAVWGADIGLAVLIAGLAATSISSWRRAAYLALGCGLVASMIANLGRQDKLAARSTVLWQAMDCITEHARPGSTVVWMSDATLARGEGHHFEHHLRHRTGGQVGFGFADDAMRSKSAEFAVSGSNSPIDDSWRLSQECVVPYWMGLRQFQCYVWTPRQSSSPETVAVQSPSYHNEE
jgi:hypothetical protein